jgi:predicted O-methyltransferase YrrM
VTSIAIPSAVTPRETTQLRSLARGGTVLELGAHFGYSTIALAQVAQIVHSVDWHQGDSMVGSMSSLEAYMGNLRRHAVTNVVTHVGRFEDVLPLFRPGQFDGVFLDGEHDAASVERDTGLMVRLVRPTGWLAWHDYGRFEVAPVVDEWAANLGREVHRVQHLAWVRV